MFNPVKNTCATYQDKFQWLLTVLSVQISELMQHDFVRIVPNTTLVSNIFGITADYLKKENKYTLSSFDYCQHATMYWVSALMHCLKQNRCPKKCVYDHQNLIKISYIPALDTAI